MALAALPTPIDLDDLTLPAPRADGDASSDRASFSSHVGTDGKQYTTVTCEERGSVSAA